MISPIMYYFSFTILRNSPD